MLSQFSQKKLNLKTHALSAWIRQSRIWCCPVNTHTFVSFVQFVSKPVLLRLMQEASTVLYAEFQSQVSRSAHKTWKLTPKSTQLQQHSLKKLR